MEIIVCILLLSLKMILHKNRAVSFRGLSLMIFSLGLILSEELGVKNIGDASFDLSIIILMLSLPICLKGFSFYNGRRSENC